MIYKRVSLIYYSLGSDTSLKFPNIEKELLSFRLVNAPFSKIFARFPYPKQSDANRMGKN